MTETLELHSIRESYEDAISRYWRALVDGAPAETVRYLFGLADGLAIALGELEAVDPLEIHVRAVAAITGRSEEARELADRARAELRRRLPAKSARIGP